MKDVVLFFYLVVGAMGTTLLVALQTGMADSLYHFIYLFAFTTLIINAVAWIPAVILVVVYRRSWLVVVPAAIILVSSIKFFFAQDLTDAPFTWTAAFFPAAFACGVVWLVKRKKGDDY